MCKLFISLKMKSKVVCLMFISTVLMMSKGFFAKDLTLKQVLILSRHNARYPLSGQLHRYSPKPWPPQAGPPGLLTPKGAQQEAYMGEYFSEWFRKEQFLHEGCPDKGTVFVYANLLSRTKATARAFIDSAFKSCNVTVHYKNTAGPDPIFDISRHNTTQAYKEKLFKKVNRKLRHNSKLKAIYSELNKILEIEGSELCKQDGICRLSEANDTVLYEVGKPIKIEGSFSIAHFVEDAFTMSFYDGMPIQNIAWGHITTPEKWKLITEMGRINQDIKFTTVGKEVAVPLVEYLTNTFKNYDEMPKLIILVGHDSNMNTVANSLGFQSVDLPNQYEKYPIGGKYVFQRWSDSKSDYLKVEYVYPGWSQLRNGSKYSLASPPQRVVMRLNWCNTDEHGFCSWNEFVDKL